MKVYVLLYDNSYDGYDFHGVFSSRENAEKRITQFNDGGIKYFEIEEVIIDEDLR